MALFGRDERPSPRSPASDVTTPPRAGATPAAVRGSRIAAGIVVRGRLTGSEPLHVDGVVEGDVVVDDVVTIGAEGRVAGRVEARSVLVYGRIEGDLAATEKAEVAASGSTEGDIEAPRVVIAEGAYFKGNVKMGRPGAAGREGGS